MIDYVKTEIANYSDKHFGIRSDAKGPLYHLKKEVVELLEVLGKGGKEEEDEWADCILLLLDAFRIRYGNDTSFNKILHFALNKLADIEDREWDEKPDEDGVFHRKRK